MAFKGDFLGLQVWDIGSGDTSGKVAVPANGYKGAEVQGSLERGGGTASVLASLCP